jgi:probable addiction module antidote protein
MDFQRQELGQPGRNGSNKSGKTGEKYCVRVWLSRLPKNSKEILACQLVTYKLQLERLQAKDGEVMNEKTSVSHDEAMVKKLRKSRAFAAEYLKAAIEDTDEPRVLLVALRQVAEARGGIAKVAKAAGIERESLYRALSPRGNPRFSTLVAVTKAMGLTLTVETAPATRH